TFLKLLNDDSPRVRFFTAIRLGKLGRKEAVPALLEMLRANNNQDRYLRHAGVMGLIGCADVSTLAALAKDDSPGVRMAAVLALRRKAGAEVAAFLDDINPQIVLEAARAISDLPISAALPPLAAKVGQASRLSQQFESARKLVDASNASAARKPSGSGETPDLLSSLLRRVINANFRLGAETNAALLAAFAASSSAPEPLRVEALNALGDWARPSGRDRITGLWRPLAPRDGQIAARALQPRLTELSSSPANTVKLAAIRVGAKLGVKAGGASAFGLLADTKQSSAVRLEALKSLDTLKDAKLADAVKLALSDTDESLRKEATRLQTHLRPKDATAQWRQTLAKGSSGEKQAALRALGAVPGTAADEILSSWMDKLLAKEVPAELQLDLLVAAAQCSAPGVKDKVTKFEHTRDPKDDLRQWRECLAGGDAAEGKKIFAEKQETQCVRCHKAGGEGGDVGPDLTHIAAQKDRAYLMESVLFPNKQIAAGFESVLVSMKNGMDYAGIVKNETDTVLELNSPEDGLLKLNKADIKARERTLSPMPEEMRQVLTKDDIRNLVEFLSGLK
ncbi:MAG TPA: c-type cytochrome, partial [Verrucomicrobiae bacterium]